MGVTTIDQDALTWARLKWKGCELDSNHDHDRVAWYCPQCESILCWCATFVPLESNIWEANRHLACQYCTLQNPSRLAEVIPI